MEVRIRDSRLNEGQGAEREGTGPRASKTAGARRLVGEGGELAATQHQGQRVDRPSFDFCDGVVVPVDGPLDRAVAPRDETVLLGRATVLVEAPPDVDPLRPSDSSGVEDDDCVPRLAPLIHKHISVLGRYRFSPESAMLGERLRPFRSVAPGELDL